MVHLSHPYMTTGKAIVVTVQTFVSAVHTDSELKAEPGLCPKAALFLTAPPLLLLWLHSLSRNWICPLEIRESKEPLDEGEWGEWKTWLKAQHSKNEDHSTWSHHFMTDRWGNNDRLSFLGSTITADGNFLAMILKYSCSLEEKLWPT